MADTQVDPLLIEYLALRDAQCPICAYSLRGTIMDRCPECGHQIVLAIQSPQRVQGLFVTGLVGLSAGMGFHLVLLGVFAYFICLEYSQSGTPPTDEILPPIVSVPTLALLVWAWTRWWRYVSRFQRWQRTGMVILCWALSAASVAWFIWQVS